MLRKAVEKKALSASKQPVLTHPAPPRRDVALAQARPQHAKCRVLRRILKKAVQPGRNERDPEAYIAM